jgi:predicted nuclease of predicted toxin-antitoxin system
LDFGAILANTGANGPSVIQVRAQNVTTESLGDLVVAVIRDHAQSLEAGALITIDESTMRVRVLPIRQR